MLAPGESQVASLFAFSDQCFVRHPAEPGARCQIRRERSHHLVNWVESIALSLAWKWIEAGVAYTQRDGLRELCQEFRTAGGEKQGH